MAINVDEITTDITLELDEGEISIADFQKATDSFLGLIKEVYNQVADKQIDTGDWLVKVYSGSAGVGVMSNERNLFADKTSEAIVSGIRSLADGFRPSEFTDKAIGHTKALASLFKKSNFDPNVRIWSKKQESVRISRKIADEATQLLAPAYEEDGAVDGILERVDAHGKLQFVIYDLIDERAIKCEVSESQLQQALSSFQKRVEVIGSVKYRKDGMPVSIKASRIVNFPDEFDIPSLAEMRALLDASNSI